MEAARSQPSPSDYRFFGILVLLRRVWRHIHALMLLLLILLHRPFTQTERQQVMIEYEALGQILNDCLDDFTR